MEENRRKLIEAIKLESEDVIDIWQELSDEEKEQNIDLVYDILKYIVKSNNFEDEDINFVIEIFFNEGFLDKTSNRIEFIKILTLLNMELDENEFINFNNEKNQYESIKSAIEFLKKLDINKEDEYMNKLLDKMLQNDIPGKEEHIYNLLAMMNNNSVEISKNLDDYIEKNKSDMKLMIIAFSKIKKNEIENSKIIDIFEELKEKKNEELIKNIDNMINDIDLDSYGEDSFIFFSDLISELTQNSLNESEIFEKYIMQICYYNRKNWKNINEEKKESVEKDVLSYFNKLFKEKTPRELMKNKTVHVFLESFKQEGLTTINPNKIKELLDNIKIPDMTEFNSLIDEEKDIPKEKLDVLFDGISAIKLKDGRIPEKYYKYVIKKTFLNEISKEKYQDIIEQSIIDMTYDYLKENGINNCIVSFGEHEKNSEKNLMGYYQNYNNIIFYSNSDFAYSPVMSNLNTAFHESTHAIQYKFLENSENNSNIVLNNKMYRILKENIIGKIDRTFSDDNYEKMDLEFDARIQGAIKTNEFLLKLGFSEKEIAILSDMELKKTLRYEIEKNSNRKEKFYRGKKVSVDELILNKLNEQQEYLELYPILKLEFKRNEKGLIERKNVPELKQDYERKIKELEKINDYEQIKNLNSIYKESLGKEYNYENEQEKSIENILLKIKKHEILSDEEYLIILLNEEQIESVNEIDLSIFMNNEKETFQKIFDKQKSIYNKIKIYESARKNNIKLDLKEINLNDLISYMENDEDKHRILEEEFLLKAFITKDEEEQIAMCDAVFETLLKRGEGIHFINSISKKTKERKMKDIINIALKTNSYNIKNLLLEISSKNCDYLYNHYDEFIKKIFMGDSELCRELCEDVIYVNEILDNRYYINESAKLPKIDIILSYHEKDKIQNLAKAHKMGIKIDIESLDINEVTESIKTMENTEQIKNCMKLFKDMLPYVDDKEKSTKIFNLFESVCKNEKIYSLDKERFLFKTLGMFNNQGFEENIEKIIDTIIRTDSFESYYCKNILEEISLLDCEYLNNHYDKFVEKIFLQDTEKCKDMRMDIYFSQFILENGKNRNNNIKLPNFLEIFMYDVENHTKKENNENRWEESLKESYEKHSAEERKEAIEEIKPSTEKSKKERLENIEI